MRKQSQPCDVPQLAEALQRLLRQPGSPTRPSCGGFYHDGEYRGPSGSYQDTVARLLWNLDSDSVYIEVSDGPHESTQLRAALKAHAGTLHSEYGVITTLIGNRVTLRLAKGN